MKNILKQSGVRAIDCVKTKKPLFHNDKFVMEQWFFSIYFCLSI